MHPTDQLCSEYSITRYRLSQRTGTGETTFSQMVINNTKLKDMKFRTVSSVSKALGITLDELDPPNPIKVLTQDWVFTNSVKQYLLMKIGLKIKRDSFLLF